MTGYSSNNYFTYASQSTNPSAHEVYARSLRGNRRAYLETIEDVGYKLMQSEYNVGFHLELDLRLKVQISCHN